MLTMVDNVSRAYYWTFFSKMESLSEKAQIIKTDRKLKGRVYLKVPVRLMGNRFRLSSLLEKGLMILQSLGITLSKM